MVAVRRFFEERFERYGRDPRSLDWSPGSQRIRFQVLCEVTDITGKTVCDLGAGLGDLWDYIRPRFAGVRFTGYDFSDVFVREARKTHPDATFEVLDVIDEPIRGRFDVVVSSGIHNLEVGTNDEDMRTFLKNAWDTAEEAVAVNMLSARATRQTEGRHYYDATKLLRAATSLAPYVVLRQDYLPHDFTFYMYRRPPKRLDARR